MTNDSRPVSPEQTRAFAIAVCRRLGIDPALVAEDGFAVDIAMGEDVGTVRLTAQVPTEELLAMFDGAAS